jgi:hypothetical protein
MTKERAPQLRAISSNTCPNARRRSMAELSMCDLDAMTVWGYCSECWQQGRVPDAWARKVDRAIEAGQAHHG